MKNFNIDFKCYQDEEYCDWYFDGIDGKNIGFYSFEFDDPEGYYFSYIDDIKSVILADFKRILDYKVIDCDHNEELSMEIENLLDTYSNNLEDREEENFIILTDSYLCFTNMESVADLGIYEKYSYKTIVIVPRDYKNFYFIRKKKDVLTDKMEILIKNFLIWEDEIETRNLFIDQQEQLFDFSSRDIDQVVNQINFQYQKRN